MATGARSLMLGVPGEDRLLGPRGLDLRHLRRLLLPGPGHRGRRRRRLGARGGPLPHPLRRLGDRHPPARPAPGLQDHAGARLRQRDHHHPVELAGRSRSSATPRCTGCGCEDTVTGERAELPVTGLFVAIGHEPNTARREGPAGARRHRLRADVRRARTRTSRGSSPAATSRTTTTARPSPRPAPAAWPPSTPSATSRPGAPEPGPPEQRPDGPAWPGNVGRPRRQMSGTARQAGRAGGRR